MALADPARLRADIFAALPHSSFGRWPTPVQRLSELEQRLGVGQLWVKRDDLSGELYGGNKVRKLEFILGDALEQGAKRTMTLGAIGSHHVLATCLYARAHELVPAAQHYPQPVTEHVLDNLRALSTTRPELSLIGHPVALPFKIFKRKLTEWLSQSQDTYFITGGGSSTQGTIGYVAGALELAEQIAQGELEAPHKIYVAAGTLGTLAGIIIGCKMAGLATRVVGVRVVDRIVTNKANTLRLIHNATQLLREANIAVPDIGMGDFDLQEGYFGKAYGEPSELGERAISLAHALAGLELDSTYTGKAFSMVMERGELGELADERALYWNTLSSVDLSARIARADIKRDLPPAYQVFFDQASS